ncbi:prefoldin subunit alpha [Candidatus Woesearchaeota archaeon]|nr:prefoldin subunit alpha [Candidatus Woesearchaeota archaeon]
MARKKDVEERRAVDEANESSGASDGFQDKYFKAQMLDQQVKQMQKYIEAFDQQLVEIRNLVSAIKEFSSLKKGTKIYAPLANGIFVKATLEDASEVAVNVGAGVVVKKTMPEAIKLLETQESELVQYRSETMTQVESLMKQAEEIKL